MTSFFVTLMTIPLATLVIAAVYRTQYSAGARMRRALVAAHLLAVIAIIATYWWLCYEWYIPTLWQYFGFLVFFAGSALFWYATFLHPVSLVPADGSGVTERGPYRWIRHPIYAGGLLGALGLVAVAPVWQTLVAWLVLAVSLGLLIWDEEKELRFRLGLAYETYRLRTSRLIPWIY